MENIKISAFVIYDQDLYNIDKEYLHEELYNITYLTTYYAIISPKDVDPKKELYYSEEYLEELDMSELLSILEEEYNGNVYYTNSMDKSELIDVLSFVTVYQHYKITEAEKRYYDMYNTLELRGDHYDERIKFIEYRLDLNSKEKEYIETTFFRYPVTAVIKIENEKGEELLEIDSNELDLDRYDYDRESWAEIMHKELIDLEFKIELREILEILPTYPEY